MPRSTSLPMRRAKPQFVIHAPSYRDDSGGIIVLHKLCHLLNEAGFSASIVPNRVGTRSTYWRRLRSWFRNKTYTTHSHYDTPLITQRDIDGNAVVIYPETDWGNPLRAKHVVRWLLHKPGFHTGKVNYGNDELLFIYDDHCMEPGYSIDQKNRLFVVSINDAYHCHGVGDRHGSCYMLRKAGNARLVHPIDDSICVDGLSHADTAAVFRARKYFYCYDEFTLYSQFAALCGCIPIVIPNTFSERAHWVEKHPISRYGVAYGLDDIPHAEATLSLVREYFEELEIESRRTVELFADVALAHFRIPSERHSKHV